MHPLLDNYLCKKYPKIFINRNKSPEESCMHWGFPGDGWFYIIDNLCDRAQHWCDTPRYVLKRNLKNILGTLWNKTVWNWIIHPLIEDMPYEELQRHADHFQFRGTCYEAPKVNPRRQFVAEQVKEKFSGLRFYFSGGYDESGTRDEYIGGLVDMAEAMSYHTCENCGRTDDEVVATIGWVVTTCPDCVRTNQKTQPRNSSDPELAKIWKQVNKDNEKAKTKLKKAVTKGKKARTKTKKS